MIKFFPKRIVHPDAVLLIKLGILFARQGMRRTLQLDEVPPLSLRVLHPVWNLEDKIHRRVLVVLGFLPLCAETVASLVGDFGRTHPPRLRILRRATTAFEFGRVLDSEKAADVWALKILRHTEGR